MTWIAALLLALGYGPVEIEAAEVLDELGRLGEYACLHEIVAGESSWDPGAIGDRDRGGSYGLPQRHAPAHGMPPWPWPVRDQILWTVEYADARYGGLCPAAEFRREERWW